MAKTLLFDFGGTLDTDGIHWLHFFEAARNELGLDNKGFKDAYVLAERTLGRGDIISSDFDFLQTLREKTRLQAEFLKGESVADAGNVADLCFSKVRSNVLNVSKPVLDALVGKFHLALVSNFYGNINAVLSQLGLDAYFKTVVESAAVGVRKPDPEFFSIALRMAGAEASDTVVIGDSVDKDIAPAASIGCQTVWLHRTPYICTDASDSCPCRYEITSLRELSSLMAILFDMK